MIGYVDTIIERQDKANVLRKTETMEVEAASRRALRDLVKFYDAEVITNRGII